MAAGRLDWHVGGMWTTSGRALKSRRFCMPKTQGTAPAGYAKTTDILHGDSVVLPGALETISKTYFIGVGISRSPPSMRSPGHGVWERTGRNRYESRVRFQGFNELGLLSNNMDVRAQYVVSSDGLSFSAVSRLRFSIEGGPTLPFCATMEGVKITL